MDNYYGPDDAQIHGYTPEHQAPKRRHSLLKRLGVFLLTILLIIPIIGTVYSWSTQDYSIPGTSTTVAEICALVTGTTRSTMDVHVILYRNNVVSGNFHYTGLPGDHVQVQSHFINWSALSSIVQPIYKLTYLQVNGQSKLIPLNGGDDDFYARVHSLSMATPKVVQAHTDKSLTWLADGVTYDISASQDKLAKSAAPMQQRGCDFSRN